LRASTLKERRADYDALPLAWASQEVDPDTGLSHYHFRENSPSLGGWLTQDPIGLAGGYLNLRSYLGNRPADALDAWGRSMWRKLAWWKKDFEPNELDKETKEHLKKEGWDHTVNSLSFRIKKCCNQQMVIDALRNKMRNFDNWDGPTDNEATLEIFEMNRERYASFNRNGFWGEIEGFGGSLIPFADKNMLVKLTRDPDGPGGNAVLQATTFNDHPLVGARRWGVDGNGCRRVTLWTASYDVGQGNFIRYKLAKPGDSPGELAEHAQFKLWNIYLKNLAESPEVKWCIEDIKVNPVIFERFKGEHPWRADLR
jgi:RHS repeat-associated protein